MITIGQLRERRLQRGGAARDERHVGRGSARCAWPKRIVSGSSRASLRVERASRSSRASRAWRAARRSAARAVLAEAARGVDEQVAPCSSSSLTRLPGQQRHDQLPAGRRSCARASAGRARAASRRRADGRRSSPACPPSRRSAASNGNITSMRSTARAIAWMRSAAPRPDRRAHVVHGGDAGGLELAPRGRG